MQKTVRSPGTEEVENPLPLPNKGCCRPCQPLLSPLFLTRKLQWDRDRPRVSAEALWSNKVTLWCPRRGLPPALGRLQPRPHPAHRLLCPAPRADLGHGCFARSGQRAEQAFRSPLPQSAAAVCWRWDRMPSLLPAAMFGFPPGAPTTNGSLRLCQEPGRPPLAGGALWLRRKHLAQRPCHLPPQAQTQTCTSSPRDAEPGRWAGGCSTCIPSQAAAFFRETKASFL